MNVSTQPPRRTRSFRESATAVAFPLGGIGTGNVSLSATGQLRDWEIFNCASKGSMFPNTFFSIWVRRGDQAPEARILEGPVQPPHNQSHGYPSWSGAGLPRFTSSTFHGEYPFAWIDLEDDSLPVLVGLEAYTPLIP